MSNIPNAINNSAIIDKINNAINTTGNINKVAEAVNNINTVAEAANNVNTVAEAANSVNNVVEAASNVNKVAEAANSVNKIAGIASAAGIAASIAANTINNTPNTFAPNAAKNVIDDLPRFAYTGSGYWGGSWYPYWTLMVITVIGGFFGADHFWIRSPLTGILKFWINIFTLGAWYFYDIIQIFKDKETVLKTGLSIPILGAQGIGAGIFTDGKDDKESEVTSPWRWFMFLILVWYPFGLDSFVAGDGMGAIVKFIGTFIPLLWPIMIIWKCIDLYQTYISPTSIWSDGLVRFFPFSFIMKPTYPTKLGPSPPIKPVGQDGLLYSLGPLGQAVAIVAEPVIDTALAPVTAVTSAVGAAAKTVEVAANSTSEIIKAATSTAVPIVKTGSAIIQMAPKAINALPSIARAVTGEVTSFTDPKKLAEMAVKQGTMVGGGATDTISMGAVILILSVLLGGGLFLGGLRLKEVLKQNQNVRSKDDKPLETPGVRSFT